MKEEMIRYSIGPCPKCSGMKGAVIPMVSYRCIDCGKVFLAVSDGYAKNGVVVKKMEN